MRRILAGVALAISLGGSAARAEPSPVEGRWTRAGAKDAVVRLEFSPKGRFQLRSMSKQNPDQFNMLVRGKWRQVRENELALLEDGPNEKWARLRFRVVDNGSTLVTEDLNEAGAPTGARHRYDRR